MSHRVCFKISTAVAWRMLTELCRRHHATQKLRVYETHPGGGQYDCLSLYADDGQRHLCDFNRSSEHLHIWHPSYEQADGLRWPDHNNFVQAFLRADDPKAVVDELETALRLPNSQNHKLPSSSPPVLMMRLVAEVLEHAALSRTHADIRWAIHDSSGIEGTYSKRNLFDIDEYRQEACQIGRDKVASRCWFLHYRETYAIADLRGVLRLKSNPKDMWNVWAEYQAGRTIHALAHQCELLLWG